MKNLHCVFIIFLFHSFSYDGLVFQFQVLLQLPRSSRLNSLINKLLYKRSILTRFSVNAFGGAMYNFHIIKIM